MTHCPLALALDTGVIAFVGEVKVRVNSLGARGAVVEVPGAIALREAVNSSTGLALAAKLQIGELVGHMGQDRLALVPKCRKGALDIGQSGGTQLQRRHEAAVKRFQV